MKNRRNWLVFFVVAVAVVGLSGCEFLFGSSENDITVFSVTGETGPATIDPENRRVVVSVEPMDLTSIGLSAVDVSVGATLGNLPTTWEDGVEHTVTVVADNGDEATWFITINVEYGVVFNYNGEKRYLTYGLVDSGGTYTAAQLANGLPAMYVDTTGTPDSNTIVAASAPLEALAAGSDLIHVMMQFDGENPDDYTGIAEIVYGDDTVDPAILASTDVFDIDSEFNLVVSTYGAVDGDVTGTFNAQLSADSGVTYDQIMTVGFFKVRRGADDL